jgi:coproporphyrinogen III oxidase
VTDTAAYSQSVRSYLIGLQDRITTALSELDGQSFIEDAWTKEPGAPLGGNGRTRILEGGSVFERAGVAFSDVNGKKLPPSATKNRPEITDSPFQAMGVSLVLHPRNPYIPTVHMNIRFLIAGHPDQAPVWWFGGGMDLTPYYAFEKDVVRFHSVCKQALDPFGTTLHPTYKRWCDEYFFLKHRNEARGVGGIFFDDLNDGGFERCFAVQKSVGDAFLDAYLPIAQRHKNAAYGQRERDFQAYRRARYVEFNLVWDRGTHFGLQSGGRTESILMSMPPSCNWRYDWKPEPGSPEEKLSTEFLVVKDWV